MLIVWKWVKVFCFGWCIFWVIFICITWDGGGSRVNLVLVGMWGRY